MKKMIVFFIVILLLPGYSHAGGQHHIDSLKQQIPKVSGGEKIMLLIQLSEMSRDISLTDCIHYGQEAITLAANEHKDSLAGLASKSMGVSYFLRSDLRDALQYFKKGLAFYKKAKSRKGTSNCLNNMGLVYESWAQFDTAYNYYKRSFDIEKALGNEKGMATSLINMGNINYYRKNYVDAQDDFFQALELFTRQNNATGMGMAYMSVGVIYNELGEYQQALDFFEKSRKIYLKNKDDWNLSRVLNNMADIYNEQFREYSKARLLYEKVLELKTSLGSKVGIALVKSNLGVLYGHMGDVSKAVTYFRESAQLYTQLKDTSGLCLNLYNWGTVLQEAGKQHQAVRKFQEDLKLATKIGYVEIENQTYKRLFKSYAALGNYELFNQYYALYEAGMDSLATERQHQQIAELETKYKVKQLVEKGQSLEQISIRQAKELRQLYLILALLVSLVVLAVIAWILVKRLRKERDEADLPNDDLS
jgi:tetratricopeptide (TPR) repeat protein